MGYVSKSDGHFCEGEVSDGVSSVLLVGTGNFALLIKNGVLRVLKKNGVDLPGGVELSLCTGSGGGNGET